jgi:hypothetical protein
MIDIDQERLFLLAKAGEHMSFPISPATAWRWALRGIGRRDERTTERVRLETVQIGGRRYTSREAVARFLARLSAPRAAAMPSPSRLRAEQTARASERAAATF